MKRVILGSLLSCLLVGQVFSAASSINATRGDELALGAVIGACALAPVNLLNERGLRPIPKFFLELATVGAVAGAVRYASRSESSFDGVLLGGFMSLVYISIGTR